MFWDFTELHNHNKENRKSKSMLALKSQGFVSEVTTNIYEEMFYHPMQLFSLNGIRVQRKKCKRTFLARNEQAQSEKKYQTGIQEGEDHRRTGVYRNPLGLLQTQTWSIALKFRDNMKQLARFLLEHNQIGNYMLSLQGRKASLFSLT